MTPPARKKAESVETLPPSQPLIVEQEEPSEGGSIPASAYRYEGEKFKPAPPKILSSARPYGNVAVFACPDKHKTKGSAKSKSVKCWKCPKVANKVMDYDYPWDGKPR